MSTNENGASDGASEGESRRSSLVQPSAFAPSLPFASAQDSNAQRPLLQPQRGTSAPSLIVSPTPLQQPGTAPSQEAGSSPDGTMIYQMLQLMQQQMQQQQQQMAQQQQMMSQIMQLHPLPHTAQSQQQPQQQLLVPHQPELTMDALASSISEFRYEAESDVTFPAWFSRYEDLFNQDASRLDDAAKS
uniref:DUF7083 domain-containing protein n=1 Tax=Anopheles dirus TaxID=7168 RepID=A0A182NN55_9DIPT